jgi:5-methylthioadenosine/S-adenosylhomocysteine deaminase
MLDTLIHNGLVLTVDGAFAVLPQGAVGVRNGCIEKVWAPAAGRPLPDARETVDACGAIVMPGLVNAHTHLPMSLFRGLADDMPLQRWLRERIFPAEAHHITPASVPWGAKLSCAEMLLGGTTTCGDGYFLADHFAGTVARTGMRAVLGQGVIDHPAPGVPDPSMNVSVARAFVEKWLGRADRLQPAVFCHSPYTCSGPTLQAAKQVAVDLGVLFQIHVAETRAERDQVQSDHGCSPIRYLERLGLLDAGTLLVHAVWLDDEEVSMVARSGAGVVHCPESNMKLAAGVAPVPELLSAGAVVGLGTDSCASNNDLDLWGEMDMAAKLHKVHRSNPTVMDAETVVRMATIQGARALGVDRLAGSLETGKRADLIILQNDQPHLTPMYHPASHLVYVARAHDVRHVMIDGQWVVRDRRLLTMDFEDIMVKVNAMARSIEVENESRHAHE